MVIIEEAGDEIEECLAATMAKYHVHLTKAGVCVKVFTYEQDDENLGKPALKLHGVPCAATMKPMPYERRVKGSGDAEIKLDKVWWENHSEDERIALFDHELCHLDFVHDAKTGAIKRDDLDRPKLRSVPHDVDLPGVFLSVVKRHKDAAGEQRAIATFINGTDGQMLMDFSKVG